MGGGGEGGSYGSRPKDGQAGQSLAKLGAHHDVYYLIFMAGYSRGPSPCPLGGYARGG